MGTHAGRSKLTTIATLTGNVPESNLLKVLQ